MHDREFAEGGLFVGGVVVHVHVRVPAPPVLHVVQEIEEGLLFSSAVVRPKRLKHGPAVRFRGGFNNPEQILQAPYPGGAVLPQRIPFEVEEDVSGARRGQFCQGVFRDDPVADAVLFAVLDVADGPLCRPRVALHPGLVLHPQQGGAGAGQRCVGQLLDGENPLLV
ncbi:hypothetical protein D9M72_530360 [compost metagenome]